MVIAIPALVPITALSALWIDDTGESVQRRWVPVTAKDGPIGSLPWFGLDRAEVARVLFPD